MFGLQVTSQRRLEVEAWLDLAGLYTDLESWRDAEICINRAKTIQFFCPRNWHATGLNITVQSIYNVFTVAFSVTNHDSLNTFRCIISS